MAMYGHTNGYVQSRYGRTMGILWTYYGHNLGHLSSNTINSHYVKHFEHTVGWLCIQITYSTQSESQSRCKEIWLYTYTVLWPITIATVSSLSPSSTLSKLRYAQVPSDEQHNSSVSYLDNSDDAISTT